MAQERSGPFKQDDMVARAGGEPAHMIGDQGQFPPWYAKMLDHPSSIVATQRFYLIGFDALEPIPIGDGVGDLQKPGEGVCQRAIKVTDDELVLHRAAPL